MSNNSRQAVTGDGRAGAGGLYRLSVVHPILVPLALLIIAVVLRILDVGVFRLDEAWGEAILHKALGFALVVAYLGAVGKSVRDIGLHGRSIGRAMLIAATGTSAVFVVGFGLQWAVLRSAGKQPAFVATAIDSKEGVTGGLFFASFLVVSNLVNSFMEEGLFRGIMLRHFRVRLSFWQANLLQAALFAAWHLVGPAKHVITGQTDLGGAAAEAAIIFLASGITGLAYGYMYLKTDSLWAPWLAHTINNTVFNLVHLRTIDGLDADTTVLYSVIAVGYIVLLLWAKVLARRFHMPEVIPWGTSSEEPVVEG